MSTLLEQFIAEGGELLDDATTGLLELERRPGDVELLNVVFRAAHTFKGSSGLFEHVELTRLVHAAEDVLDGLRRGEIELDAALVDDVMAALDLARTWLGAIEAGGVLPAGAAAVGQACIVALRGRVDVEVAAPAPPAAGAQAPPAWAQTLADTLSPTAAEACRGARTSGGVVRAIRYSPAPDCFFRGEDPLALVRELEVVHLALEREGDWPPIAEFDEYVCALRFAFVTTAPAAGIDDVLRYVLDEVEIVELPGPAAGTATPSSGAAQTMIDGQRRALAADCPPGDEAVRLRAIADTLLRALAIEDRAPESVLAGAGALLATPDRAGLGDLLDALAADAAPAPPRAPEPPAAEVAPSSPPPRSAPAARSIKVEQHKLDHLLELVGELIVAKNALPFLARGAEQGEEPRTLARAIKDQHVVLNRLTDELQETAMGMRMLPVSVVFSRFPRLVRDTARKLGKEVRLETAGEETAADKDVLEQLADPLVHLMRNSLDHGLEGPEERVAAGKAPEGTITLTATQQPDGVTIELRDDGRGIDAAAVRAAAYAKGLISEQEAESLDDRAARELLFRPGFSTAETVSDLSGRGVGMDAVRTSVIRLGGSMTLESEPGAGTTVRLRLPLSMAVTKVMVVSAGGQPFGVPVDVVRETVRLPRLSLQAVGGRPATVRRGAVVPIVDLAGTLGLRAAPRAEGDDDDVRLLVVSPGRGEVALVVEGFEEYLDVIVKPLEGVLAGLAGIAGSSLLGDGNVLLILDVKEMLPDADSPR